jgi:hypothetical protein
MLGAVIQVPAPREQRRHRWRWTCDTDNSVTRLVRLNLTPNRSSLEGKLLAVYDRGIRLFLVCLAADGASYTMSVGSAGGGDGGIKLTIRLVRALMAKGMTLRHLGFAARTCARVLRIGVLRCFGEEFALR